VVLGLSVPVLAESCSRFSKMCPYIEVFERKIATYGIMMGFGCLAAVTVSMFRCKRKGLKADDMLYFFAFILVFAGAGAKLWYVIQHLPQFLRNRALIFESARSFLTYLGGGFVFYGGLLGGCCGAFLYAHFFGENSVALAENFTVAVPLFHCFGRIGCFLTGCCYGIECEGVFSVVYHESPVAENGIGYFPVQPVEAGVNLILFFILLLATDRLKKPLQNFGLYAILYSILRFFLEFLRGDEIRGMIGPLTVSQWCGMLVILPLGVYMFCCDPEKNFITRKLLLGSLK